MSKWCLIIATATSLFISCADSSDQCRPNCYGTFVVDSLFASVQIDTCQSGDDGIFARGRIVYHFDNLDGGVIEYCVSVENTYWGTICAVCPIPQCQTYPKPHSKMYELEFSHGGCPRTTEEDTLNLILRVKSLFWNEEATISDNGITYYNDYVWIDTISVEVQR